MNRKIIWESYHIDENLDDFITNDSFVDEIDEEFSDMQVIPFEKPPQLFNTPFGWVNLDQRLNPFAEHKLWKMYTNFNISQSVKNIITGIDGVEVLTVISRYMCIIGVGKLFDSPTVRYNIETTLEIDRESNDYEIEKIQKELLQYNYWGIVQFPNGTYEYFHSDSQDDFEQSISIYEEACDLSGGHCYSSERNNEKNRQ